MKSQTTTNKSVTDNKAQMFTLFFLLSLFSFVVIFPFTASVGQLHTNH